MKINQFKIILYTFILLLIASSFSLTYASNVSVFISPTTASKYVNDNTNTNTNVNVDPAGNDVCVVKGSLIFENLSCKSITLTEGLMAQSVPTCSKPNFVIGIPSCTKTEKTLFSINTGFSNVGTSSIKLSNISVIGIGVAASSTSIDGNFTVLTKEVVKEPVVVDTDKDTNVIDDTETTINDTEKEVIASSSETEDTEIDVEVPKKKFNLLASINDILSNISGEVVAWIVIIMVATIIIITGWKADHKEHKKEDDNKDNK